LSPGNYGSDAFDRFASREKAVGIYAGGLLLQLPVPGARFCCNSMLHDHADIFNKILKRLRVAHHFCAISTEIAPPVHSIIIDSVVSSGMC
jgi:DNA-directed RNA polymerase subunit N (RpoN/RPB10)